MNVPFVSKRSLETDDGENAAAANSKTNALYIAELLRSRRPCLKPSHHLSYLSSITHIDAAVTEMRE